MTTTDIIKLLKDNEYGAISHKPREISLTINGKYMPNPSIALSSTGDGIAGPEIDLDIIGEFMTLEQEPCDEDTISRQPTQSIAEWQKDFREYINMLNIPRDDYKGIMEYINDAPSTQPEILRCKECEHWDTSWQNDYAPNYHYCPLVDGTRRDDFYCADAERKVNNPQESEGRTNK